MKGTAEELFAAFRFKVGDIVRSRANSKATFVVLKRFLREGDEWAPVYLVRYVTDHGPLGGEIMYEIELRKVA